LVLNKRLADINAIDYHPEVEEYLLVYTEINDTNVIPFTRAGWDDEVSKLSLFDIIIGSDLLYENGHAYSLSKLVSQHAKPKCKVILIYPCRKHHARFSKNIVKLGYPHS